MDAEKLIAATTGLLVAFLAVLGVLARWAAGVRATAAREADAEADKKVADARADDVRKLLEKLADASTRASRDHSAELRIFAEMGRRRTESDKKLEAHLNGVSSDIRDLTKTITELSVLVAGLGPCQLPGDSDDSRTRS